MYLLSARKEPLLSDCHISFMLRRSLGVDNTEFYDHININKPSWHFCCQPFIASLDTRKWRRKIPRIFLFLLVSQKKVSRVGENLQMCMEVQSYGATTFHNA